MASTYFPHFPSHSPPSLLPPPPLPLSRRPSVDPRHPCHRLQLHHRPHFLPVRPPPRGSQNLYTYSRFSLAKSLSNARKFLNTVNRYLSRRSTCRTPPSTPSRTVSLAELNIDFLVSASSTANSSSTLLDPQTDKLQTLLSALLTNQQTCLDGLQAATSWSVKNGLSAPSPTATSSTASPCPSSTAPGSRRSPRRPATSPCRPKKFLSPTEGSCCSTKSTSAAAATAGCQ
ncbi:putative pectinesterase/pectinesterase inhibitor 41 [Iris pallida]|uniref:Pectinesterase/pectinesterase inhibitor 41 n=1 Tax=Iris pallida TaxID=29817 RepID=A0AAX6DR72_IRIPA|nr:putative pectinesterase/pectinesterase inhibitor 41 [Iris pallida]